MLIPVYRKSFEKDVKRAKKRGKFMDKLKSTLTVLIEQRELTIKCRDHALLGNYAHHREYHIEPDWLLIYKIYNDEIIFERTRSHADLFE